MHVCMWQKLTVVYMKNNAIINNNTRINYVSGTHNCKPTFANPICVCMCVSLCIYVGVILYVHVYVMFAHHVSLYINVCMCVCTCVCICGCMGAYMYASAHVFMCV